MLTLKQSIGADAKHYDTTAKLKRRQSTRSFLSNKLTHFYGLV